MARPLKEGMSYFPHDTDAVNDEKIEALRALHKNDGYAFYFILLERIYRTETGEIDLGTPTKRMIIASKLSISKEEFEAILLTAFEVELFDKGYYENSGFLTSNGIKKRFAEVVKLREKWRSKKVFSGENRGENSEITQQETPERKEKKSKVNESIKEKDIIPFSEIIDHLNRTCGTNFRLSSKATKQHIQARWNEGFILEDFKKVIDIKSAQWRHDPKMSQYLRPPTLFGAKFESYLNANIGEVKTNGTNGESKYAAILNREIPEPEYDPTIF